jgi:flagellin
MAISIQTNVNSLVAQENLRITNEFQGRTIQRLTSGFRINSSADDAAGLAVANKFRADVAELTQGVRNANDAISTLQLVDGGLNNVSKLMDRLKTLASQSASGTFSGDRSTLNNEYQALLKEIDRQAANIGLVNGGNNNKVLGIYIGGGSNATNAQRAGEHRPERQFEPG